MTVVKLWQWLTFWELNTWLRNRGSDTAVANTIIGQTTKALWAPRKSFTGGSVINNPPAMQEVWVLSLGGEEPLEEGIASHSSFLVWRIPWTEEPGRLQHRVAKNRTRLKWLSTQKELPNLLVWIRVSDMVVREDFLEEEEVTGLTMRHLWQWEGRRRKKSRKKEVTLEASRTASLF